MSKIFKLLGAMIAMIIVFIIGIVLFFPKEKIAQKAFDKLEQQIGRKLTVNGDVGLSFFPVVGINAHNLNLANSDWSNTPEMISAGELQIALNVIPLFSGEVEFKKLSFKDVEILLEKSKTNQVNWDFSNVSYSDDAAVNDATVQIVSDETSTSFPKIDLGLAEIQNLTITYMDHNTGMRQSLNDINAQINWPTFDSPMLINADAKYLQGALGINIEIEKLSEMLSGEPFHYDATIQSQNGRLTAIGSMDVLANFSADIDANIKSTSKFLSDLGIRDVQFQPNLGASLAASAGLRFDGEKLGVNEMNLSSGKNRILGSLDVILSDIPNISGNLDVGELDLRGPVNLQADQSEENRKNDNEGWSKVPIDASFLKSFNADLAINATGIFLDALKLGNTQGKLSVKKARAVFEAQNISAYSGDISGVFVANAANGLSVSLKTDLNQVSLQELMNDVLDIKKADGKAQLHLDLLSSGNSVDQLVRNLKGTAKIAIDQGRWTGIDLDKLMRSGDTDKGTTLFDAFSASFNIEQGIAENSDLIFQLPKFETTGKGQIDLGNKSLDYTVTPNAKAAREGQGLAIPVRLVGPWDNPKIFPDLAAAAQQKLDKEIQAATEKAQQKIDETKKKAQDKVNEEKKKLEEKAKKEVQKTLGGIDPNSIQEGLKNKLEDEAKKGILNLLGGGN